MYVHCHQRGCGWSQDDFYTESYNHASYLETWNNFLFGTDRNKLNNIFSSTQQWDNITVRENIAREYENFAQRIRNMKWMTYEDFKNDKNPICPNCGSSDLDID